LVFGYLAYLVLKPFAYPIIWGIVLSLIFYPIYAYLIKYIKNNTISSVITLLIVICIVMGPFLYLGYLITLEINHLIEYFKSNELTTLDKIMDYPVMSRLSKKILSVFNLTQ